MSAEEVKSKELEAPQNNEEDSSNRILNKDEVDTLLESDETALAVQKKGIDAIINSGMVSYERLPMLEVVYDRLVRMLSTSLRNFTSDNVEVSIEEMNAVRFGDYLNSVPMPVMIAVFKAREWDNYGLIVTDSALIYSIVDVLLGGRRGMSAMSIEGRPFTTIERNLVERLIDVVLQDLSDAFKPLSPVTFKFERLETNPRFATVVRPANTAILTQLRIDMEDRGGRLDVIIPYGTLEPIRELLLQMFMGEKFGQDSIWESHLASELEETDVELKVILDESLISLNDVMNWEVGTQIILDARPDSMVKLRCDDLDMFEGKMGHSNNKIAIHIEKELYKGS